MGFAFGGDEPQDVQVQSNQDPEPFDAALVSRVVNDIFWPSPAFPDLDKSVSEMPEAPSPGFTQTSLPGSPAAPNGERPPDSPPPTPSWTPSFGRLSSPKPSGTWGDPLSLRVNPFLTNPAPIKTMPISEVR